MSRCDLAYTAPQQRRRCSVEAQIRAGVSTNPISSQYLASETKPRPIDLTARIETHRRFLKTWHIGFGVWRVRCDDQAVLLVNSEIIGDHQWRQRLAS